LTTLFLVADIFGRTRALEIIGQQLSEAVPDIRIIDPYQGLDHLFKTEARAYTYFTDRVGLACYASILTDALADPGPDTILIGFSVGASAIWSVSDRPSFRHIKKAFCFYGSQIRQYTGIQPRFDMELIFPEREPHFDVDELIHTLQAKDRVSCSKAKGLHGFMNELSPHFNPDCYAVFMKDLKTALIRLN
jgi:dienelactone hydrolase